MTSGKSLFSINVFWESVKQSRYLMMLHAIALLIVTTLPAYMTFWNYHDHFTDKPSAIQLETITQSLSGFGAIMFCLAVVMVVMSVSNGFGYLFKANSVQFYNCMPYSRSCMYISKFAATLVSLIVPLIAVFAINLATYYWMGLYDEGPAINILPLMGCVVLSYGVLLCMVTFAVSVAGSFFAMLFAGVFTALWGAALAVAAYVFTSVWEFGFVIMASNTLEYFFTPAVLSLKDIEYSIEPTWLILSFLNIIVFFALGLICYNRRKSENTNKFFVFEELSAFVKYYASFVAAMVLGPIAGDFIRSGLLIIVGYVVVFILMYGILQAVFDKSLRSLFKDMITPVIVSAVFAVLLIPCTFDFIQVESMPAFLCRSVMVDTRETAFEVRDRKVIKEIMHGMKSDGYNHVSYSADIGSPFVHVDISTYIADEKYERLSDKILSSTDYKEELKRVIDGAPGGSWYAAGQELYDISDKELYEYISDKELYECLKRDIEKYDYNTAKESGVFATWRPNEYSKSYAEWDSRLGQWNYIRIYNCYEETVNYLLENTIIEQSVDAWDRLYIESEAWDSVKFYETEDKEVIKKILYSCGRYVGGSGGSMNIHVENDEYGGTNDIHTNYYSFSEEVKNIINPEGLSYEELTGTAELKIGE